MARKNRNKNTALIERLVRDGRGFSFFQAIRLMRTISRNYKKKPSIDIKTELSFTFPSASVSKITQDNGAFNMVTTLPGLYGTSSPLAAFFTERLFSEQNDDQSSLRDFIDIFNQKFYKNFFRAWLKHNNLIQVIEENSDNHLQRLYSLIGLAESEWRNSTENSYKLLKYSGLLSQSPRSALGLLQFLQDNFKEVKIEIIQCIKQVLKIPIDQINYLAKKNSTLGTNINLGKHITDNSKFTIVLWFKTGQLFRNFLPGTPNFIKVVKLTNFFTNNNFAFNITNKLPANKASKVQLGAPHWSSLGKDTWIFSESHETELISTY